MLEEGSARMELSEPPIMTSNDELIAAHRGNAGAAVDPFFTNVKTELSDKGFLVASADNLIAWARTGSLMWMQFGLSCCAIDKSFCGLVGRRRPKSTYRVRLTVKCLHCGHVGTLGGYHGQGHGH